jgi:hypothetical protein
MSNIPIKRSFNVHKIMRCQRWLRKLIHLNHQQKLKPASSQSEVFSFVGEHFLPSFSLKAFNRLVNRIQSPNGEFILLSHHVDSAVYYVAEQHGEPIEIHVNVRTWDCGVFGGTITDEMRNMIIEDAKIRVVSVREEDDDDDI